MENNDYEIVQALLQHDNQITKDFFYIKCYPLFKSVYDNFHTDCSSCLEFINEIYIHVMLPNKETGICKLASFKFQSTLFTWLKTVCLFYCYRRYARKEKASIFPLTENYDDEGVRFDTIHGSIDIDLTDLHGLDVEIILRLMPNKRYSLLIRYCYLEGRSYEETALLLGMNMNTFYNKHKMAKEQFIKTLRKEDLLYGTNRK